MPTKPELEQQVKTLKQVIKDLHEELKEKLNNTDPDLGEKPYRAIGLFKEGTKYKLARLDYNPETKATKLVSTEDASKVPEAAHMAKFNIEKVLLEEIFKRLEEEESND